ncbi:TPA: hypothetical protein ACFOXQ_001989, partial [Neisseria meningitidis]
MVRVSCIGVADFDSNTVRTGRDASDGGGFAFEVQLSLTEKGQYAVAYGLSCKKDCHELHATDP